MTEMTESFSFRLTEEESNRLDYLSTITFLTRSDIVRILIRKAEPNPMYYLPIFIGKLSLWQRILLALGGAKWITNSNPY